MSHPLTILALGVAVIWSFVPSLPFPVWAQIALFVAFWAGVFL